jgi:trehalose/maltose transport system permease protein
MNSPALSQVGPGPVPQQQAGQSSPAPLIFSGLFILAGLGTLALLVATILREPAIRLVLDWAGAEDERPSLVLAFLDRFGMVLPLLILGLGVGFTRLGFWLLTRRIEAARWAHIALLWLCVGLAGFTLLNIINSLRAIGADPESGLTTVQLLPIIVSACLIIPTGAGYLWLDRNILRAFEGQEHLTSRQTRLAWNLLIPTLTVVILVAARPLEQTFIRSLTDKRFAGSAVPNFVGLANYTNLLGIRIDTVTCRTDASTGECATRPDGSIRWESIDRALLEQRYRTAWTIQLPSGDGTPRALAISGLDADFLRAITTTLGFAAVSVTLELMIGLSIALTVNSSFAGRGFMRAVMLIPWAIPTVISARLWELMLKDTSAGIINRILMDLSLINAPQAWLSDPGLQLPAAIMVDVWKTSPFMALLLLAGLQTIPRDLYEVASVDGASKLRQFLSITLPLLRPTIAVALVFRTLDALRVFDLFNVLFSRQQLSMATYNYETLINNQREGYASAVSMVIFVLISIFAFLYVRMLKVETD